LQYPKNILMHRW